MNLSFIRALSDRYYKPIVALGIVLTSLRFISLDPGDPFLYLGLAVFFFGSGEWATHRELHAPPNVYWNPRGTLIQLERIWTIPGLAFYIFSGLSFTAFLYFLLTQ
ncbi:MAG: hypothetical protein ACE5KH_03865 [Candidatus Geothermarchaeales archaeon]